ncbi:hypothetical protein GE09DRAFT_173720 [Coniochaeta sp. 2T2.1]|nr:hypothetical protein GE09DRAFT_173720 [Coniochaeta sp. 2T2.1]
MAGKNVGFNCFLLIAPILILLQNELLVLHGRAVSSNDSTWVCRRRKIGNSTPPTAAPVDHVLGGAGGNHCTLAVLPDAAYKVKWTIPNRSSVATFVSRTVLAEQVNGQSVHRREKDAPLLFIVA